MTISILIGGAAGQGINTTEQLLLKSLTKQGYYYHSYKDYMSRVRGGVNFTQITLSNQPIQVHFESLDIIIALTQDVIDTQLSRLKPEGLLICDDDHDLTITSAIKVCKLPFKEILNKTENPKGLSMIALGALAKALTLNEKQLEEMMNPKWPPAFLNKNKATSQLAFEKSTPYIQMIPGNTTGTVSLSGNHAVALGALASGISFYAAYPMAPSTSVMNYVTQYEKPLEVLVEQVEDEIAAVIAVIGASATGVRAMTSTSGGGLCLMVEGLGLAAVSEVPLVVLDVQRPGPATGMATRTEQSDLNFVLNASQGEFPRIIMSFRNVSDCFYQTFRAFNLADKYRVPVILLSDQYLGDSVSTIPVFDLESLEINRHLAKEFNPDYRHYDLRTPLQDRSCPGFSEQIIMNDSHEHDEYSHVTESGENRVLMNHRRMQKLPLIENDLLEPEYYGAENPTHVFVAWGSVVEAAKETVRLLNDEKSHIGLLGFGDLYPLPKKSLKEWHSKGVKFINVEGNYQGQLAQLIACETGILITDSILKFDGRQFTPDYIITAYKEMI